MKKAIALLLTLLMVLSLAACGSRTNTEGSSSTGEQTGATTSIPEQDKKPSSSQETSNPDGTSVSSDNSNWGESVDSIIDKMAKPSNAVISDSGADYVTYTLNNATYQDVIDYENILKPEVFFIRLTSTYGNYEAEADHVQAEIKIVFRYTGTEYISSPADYAKRAEQGIKDPGILSVTIRMRALGSYNLPALPEGDWRTDDNNYYVIHKLNSYKNCSKEERRTLAKNYVELLKAGGYTLDVAEYPDGKDGNYVAGYESLYEFSAKDKIGNHVTVKVATRKNFDPYHEANTDDWAEVEITLKKVANK